METSESIYEGTIQYIFRRTERISFGDLKKVAEEDLRNHNKSGLVDSFYDLAPHLVVRMIAEGEIATMCDDEDCDKRFGDSEYLPICDKCVIYPPRRIIGFKKDSEGNFLFNETVDVPYDHRLQF